MNNNIILALYITDKCNLRCDYCFVKKADRVMDVEYAKRIIKHFVNKGELKITPTFLGGEPLIEWSLIKEIVTYSEMHGIRGFNLATNGLLITKNKIDYFINHNFKIQLSFDGVRQVQNCSRRRINGSGTFEELQKSLNLFLMYSNRISPEIRMTITRKNLGFLSKSIIFISEIGFRKNRINIMPVIDKLWEKSDFKRLLFEARIIKKYFNTLKLQPNIFINECIDKKHANIFCLSENCSCGYGSRVICIDCDGKAYSCFIPAGLNAGTKKLFLISDVDDAILFKKSCHKNKYLGCPIWIALYGNKALRIYKKIYEIWNEK
jgi:uncharacterized protein